MLCLLFTSPQPCCGFQRAAAPWGTGNREEDLLCLPVLLSWRHRGSSSSSSRQGQCCQSLPGHTSPAECSGMEQERLRKLNLTRWFALKHHQTPQGAEAPRLRQPKSTSGAKQPKSTTAADPNQDGGTVILGMLESLRGLQLCNQVIQGLLVCSQLQVENAASD